jgi:AbiU2
MAFNRMFTLLEFFLFLVKLKCPKTIKQLAVKILLGKNKMASIEEKFRAELEVFKSEVESSLQFLYSFNALKMRIREDNEFLESINRAPLFWRTQLGAMQTSLFITLGRIFDCNSRHNVYKLLSLAENGCEEIFSKDALAKRKRKRSENADEWLPEYLANVHEPKEFEFSRLKQLVKKRNNIYDAKYKIIRNKIFAHKELTDPIRVEKLFAKTNMRELEQICIFLMRLQVTLWMLTENGRKPVLRPSTYSIKSIRKKQLKDKAHERIVFEVFQKLGDSYKA